MDIEKLIGRLKKSCWGESEHLVDKERIEAAAALSTLQAENERMRATVDSWKKKYVEANGKWIEAENKWYGLDKAVKNGNVYRPMQEELNLTHEENQLLKDANEKLRAELEQAREALDFARIKDAEIVRLGRELPQAHYGGSRNEHW